MLNSCLSEASYYIESNGEAAVIDPLRDVTTYVAEAQKRQAVIRYVFETHVHADFVSGHQELAAQQHSTIVFGPTANPEFPAHIARDHEVFKLGKISIQVLHTPGHGLEAVCLLVLDAHGKPQFVFTGDTLLLGDAGRPDLAQQLQASFTPEFLAGLQYDAIRRQLFCLPDDVVIYPGHFKGSPCARHMDGTTSDTMGNQRQTHFALQPGVSREEYVQWAVKNHVPAPPYYPITMLLNQQAMALTMEELMQKNCQPIAPQQFGELMTAENALVIDTRKRFQYPKAFIPGSIFLGLEDHFSRWAGTLINDIHRPLLIVANEGEEQEVIRRLALVGYDDVIGYLEGGMEAWQQFGGKTIALRQVNPAQLIEATDGTTLLDLRSFEEFEESHIPGAHSFPLEHLQRNLKYLDHRKAYILYCATGYRSMIAASRMMSLGFVAVAHLKGGIQAWKSNIAAA